MKRHVIDVLSHVGKDLRNPRAGLAVLLELKRRLQHFAAGGEEPGLGIGAFELHAVALLQFRLVVERVDLRGLPGMNSQITTLALGAKCGLPLTSAAGRPRWLSKADPPR